MDERDRQQLIREAAAASQAASRDHGWDSAEASAAHQNLLEVERVTAARMDLPYASPVDLGAQWDPGAPMPCLLAGIRTFLIYYLRHDDPLFESLGPGEPGWDQEHGLGVIEFRQVEAVKMGSPNDEVLRGHLLHGCGLEPYGAQVVSNSPWIRELADVNRVHPQFSEDNWAAMRHYIFPFHDETVECIAKDATAWTDRRAMHDVIRQLAVHALQADREQR
jgi:hypothetical protein